ncbi:unnamed protein product, partial [Iphiclides podalirius]
MHWSRLTILMATVMIDTECMSDSSSSSEDYEPSLFSELDDGSISDLEDLLKAKLKLKNMLFKMDKKYLIQKLRDELSEEEKNEVKYFESILKNVKSITKSQ